MNAKDEISECTKRLFSIQDRCEHWKSCQDGSYEMSMDMAGAGPLEKRLSYLKSDQAKFDFLVRLRDAGVVNMWGAGEYVSDQFGLTEQEGSDVLLRWIATFDKE